MDKAFQIAINRETRRGGTSLVTNKDRILSLKDKTSGLTSSTFDKGEIIELTADKAKLMDGEIRNSSTPLLRLLVQTNKGIRNLYLTTFHKRRIKVDESDPKNPVVTDVSKDNYGSQVGMFFELCPSQLQFLAAILGTKIECTEVEKFKAAGFDPKGGPNGNGGTDMNPQHATNATVCQFKFVGNKTPELKEEWLDDEKAVEYIAKFFGITE